MRPARTLGVLAALAVLIALAAWRFLAPAPMATPLPLQHVNEETNAVAGRPAPLEQSAVSSVAASAPTRELLAAPTTERTAAATPRIRGRVVRAGDHQPVPGVRVKCGLGDVVPRRAAFDFVLPDPPPASTSAALPPSRITDAQGRFEFASLNANGTYSLAVDVELASYAHALHDIVPSEEEHEIVVQTLYAARVVATEEDGSPLRVAECQFLRYAREAGPGDCPAIELSNEVQPDATSTLAIPPDAADDDEERKPALARTARRYVFAADCAAGRLGPFRVLVCAPGFAREEHDFYAAPLATGTPEIVLRLKRLPESDGRLVLHQACPCDAQRCMHLVAGELVLEPLHGERSTLTLPTSGVERDTEWTHLREGEYRARFAATHGGFVHPRKDEEPALVTVTAQGARLELPVAGLGTADFVVRSAENGTPKGSVRLEFVGEPEGSSRGDVWNMLVLRGLTAGPRRALVKKGALSAVEGATLHTTADGTWLLFDVVAGQTTSVTLYLR